MSAKYISKSQYVKGKQCPKALWFYRYRKDLKPEIDESLQAIFDTGNEIGLLAQECFPGGIEVKSEYWNIKEGERQTKDFLLQGYSFVFEATAIHPKTNDYSFIDILRKNEDGSYDLIEVKSSTEVKDYHLDDMSFQYNVFSAAGYKIKKCLMMIINNQYIRKGDIEPEKLFKFQDITSKVIDKQKEVEEISSNLKKILNDKNNEPNINIEAHCDSPHECEYKYHCWNHVPKYSIINLFRKDKAFKIINEIKSFDIQNLDASQYPKGNKFVDLQAFIENKTIINKAEIRAFLNQIKYPLYFLDYETINPAIPAYDNSRPFEQVPFQFSLHIQETENSELIHTDFLHQERTDPRKDFTENLISACGNTGSIISYNAPFEQSRNKDLIRLFPEYGSKLSSINNRMIDLQIPFRSRWLYSPEQNGSYSIKAVLPAFTKLNYSELDIGNGQVAMDLYKSFALGDLIDREKLKKLWQNLSEYCKLDTLAMVELLRVLRSLV